MDRKAIAEFLRREIEPLPDGIYGDRYRVAAYLKDGTYLPCVVFQSRKLQVDLASRRFEQIKREEPNNYRSIVETFVASGSSVADYQIDRVEVSPFAWPLTLLDTIEGETSMGWTAFVAEMDDGRRFSYGTQFHFEFFALPTGYGHQSIRRIESGVIHTDDLGTRPFTLNTDSAVPYLREKAFFSCYFAELDPPPSPNSAGSEEKRRWYRFW